VPVGQMYNEALELPNGMAADRADSRVRVQVVLGQDVVLEVSPGHVPQDHVGRGSTRFAHVAFVQDLRRLGQRLK